MIRAFFAIPVTTQERRLIQSALGPLTHRLGDAVHWIPVANWHITIRFLGNIDSRAVAAMAQAAEAALSHIKGFPISINKISGFPALNSRTVAGHVMLNESLKHLFSALDAAAAALGVGSDKRRFRPHITLAKFRGDVWQYDPILLEDLSFEAANLVLYKSISENGSSQYVPLKSFPFAS